MRPFHSVLFSARVLPARVSSLTCLTWLCSEAWRERGGDGGGKCPARHEKQPVRLKANQRPALNHADSTRLGVVHASARWLCNEGAYSMCLAVCLSRSQPASTCSLYVLVCPTTKRIVKTPASVVCVKYAWPVRLTRSRRRALSLLSDCSELCSGGRYLRQTVLKGVGASSSKSASDSTPFVKKHVA